MSLSTESLCQDLGAFADLGAGPPRLVQDGGVSVCRMIRNGHSLELIFEGTGKIREVNEGEERLHVNFRALLASRSFADLGRWADSQRILLEERVSKETIDVSGVSSDGGKSGGINLLDDEINNGGTNANHARVLVTLIDGPAGIGKTSIIRRLSYKRALEYRSHQRALILHVESRGRVLQNITDLMAFSLQTLRLNVTYDQIPILVRNGLVTLAVDGFDELGDPNGYELAWAQINELITSARGSGSLVLSGRETFVSQSRMESALSAVDKRHDAIKTFSLDAIRPHIAKKWLGTMGWTEDQLEADAAKPLFEDGSYALKPFFLSELARRGVPEQICEGDIEDLLSFLVASMLKRESTKFGKDIDNITSESTRIKFITSLMEEIARDMAENQSGAVPDESISWLSEVVADNLVPRELIGILKNRGAVIAFLTEDERRGYKDLHTNRFRISSCRK